MNLILRIIAIIFSTFFLYKVVFKHIAKNDYNIMHVTFILFYFAQTLPILQEIIFGIDNDIVMYGITYNALIDKRTDVLYSLFIIVVSFLMYVLALKINKNTKNRFNFSENSKKFKQSFIFKNKTFRTIVFCGMFITIPFIIFSPDIRLYTKFASIYVDNISSSSSEYIYHVSVVGKLNIIAFLSSLFYYLINDKKRNNLFVIISAILFTWVNQKRTMILFFLLGVLFIDLFIKNKDKKTVLKKAILFFMIEFIYFFAYRYITGKGMDHTFNWIYTFYFSRMAHVKVSIYDFFLNRDMISFPGKSFLAELFWFIPRSIWSGKPYPYDIYYTAFVYGKNILETSWNFQVNMWSEFISNFSVLGPLLAIFMIYYVSKLIEKVRSVFAYLFGAFFVMLYSVFGCTGITLYSLSLFILFSVISFLHSFYKKMGIDFKHFRLNDVLNVFFLSDKLYLQIKFYKRFHRFINFKDPKTFNEKLQWLKINDRKDIYTSMVDKCEAKKIVSKIIGDKYLIPTLAVYDNFDVIKFDKLPNEFVIKCTHDSGGVIICNNKEKFDYESAKEKIAKSFDRNYYYHGREWPYKNLKPRILIEKYMKDEKLSELIDYKVMCFNGEPKMIFTCTERFTGGLKVTFFDLKWNKLPFERHYPSSNKKIRKPKNLKKMIDFSRKMSKDLTFVRIDWYEINGNLFFGEYTFYPGDGFEEFTPEKWDTIIGSWINLKK